MPGHSRRSRFPRFVPHTSTFLRSFARRALPRFHATMTALTPEPAALRLRTSSMNTGGPGSGLPVSRTRPSDRSVSNHLTAPRRRFDTLPISATGFPGGGWASPLASRLAETARPNRLRHPTDRSFVSCCSPPHLTATQLQSTTGRRTHAWEGLTPSCSRTLAGALAQHVVLGQRIAAQPHLGPAGTAERSVVPAGL